MATIQLPSRKGAVPPGGTINQVLAKLSNANWDYAWMTYTGGSSVISSVFGRTGAIIAQSGDYGFSLLSGTLSLSQTSMNTNKLLGRGSVGGGPFEEITLGTNLSLSGTTLNATGGGGSTLVGKNLFVDSINGDDGTGTRGDAGKPFLTITAAVAAASSGDVVRVGPGTFAFGTTKLQMPAGVSMIGSGIDVSIITQTSVSAVHALIAPASNTTIEGFTIGSDLGTNASPGAPIGCMGSDTAASNVTIRNCKFIGNTDGFYFSNAGTYGNWKVYDSIVSTTWDTIFVNAAGTPGIFEFYNCTFLSDGSVVTGGTNASGVNSAAGTTRIYGGRITITSQPSPVGIRSTGSGATAEGHGVRLEVSGSGSPLDLKQASSSVTTTEDCFRSDGAALVTSGTITDLQKVSLATGVTGNLDHTHLNSGTGASSSTFWRGDDTWAVPAGGGNVSTTGSPANGNLTKFTGATTISNGDLSGDVTTSGTLATTLANIPDLVPAVGSILHTNIAAPASPAAGKVKVFTDSTDLRLHDKNSAGTIGTTVVADTGASNNFLTAISAAGVISKAQPTPTNVGLGNVTNDAQTKAAIVPNTAPSAGQILVGNAGGTAYAPQTVSGSGATITVASTGVHTISAIPNASLSNSAITIAGTSTSLGGSISLDTISGVSSNGFLKRTGANTWTNDASTYLTANQTITLSGDVTGSGTTAITTTLANIPDLTPAVGSILFTNIAAPSSPAATKDKVWFDTTDQRLHEKNSAGTIGTTVVANTGAANNFLTAISAAGVVSRAQPTFLNLSDSAGAYTGNAGKAVRVNAGETALEYFTASGSGTVTSIATTSPITGGPITTTGTIGLDVTVDHLFTIQQSITLASTIINAPGSALKLQNNRSDAVGGNGLGVGITFNAESSTTDNRNQGALQTAWSDATDATRTAYMDFLLVNSAAAAASKMRLFPSGGLSVNSTTDPGAGIVNANTGFEVGAAAGTGGQELVSNGSSFVTGNSAPDTMNDYGSISVPDTGNLLQPNRSTLSSTSRATMAGTGRISLYDILGNHPRKTQASAGSFLIKQGEGILQYLRILFAGNARATMTENARIVVTDLTPGCRLVLAGGPS